MKYLLEKAWIPIVFHNYFKDFYNRCSNYLKNKNEMETIFYKTKKIIFRVRNFSRE